ncbi:PD-(D/E)XK nuclease family protein [Vibrio owensii]|uniref:PD-(D/E)XK nuclease family protein n=1 Tax=Vibrio owensii TaxID=696485 RepID=UPI00390A60A9
MDNYINIVGFQFEKVHTGVIKWCLDSKASPSNEQIKIIQSLYEHLKKPIPFAIDSITKIHCTPEYSFGRSVRIDLLIEIYVENSVYRLACEMKVDSDPYEKQLDSIVEQVDGESVDSSKNDYLLILIGSAAVMRNVGDQHAKFTVLTNTDLIRIFSEYNNESYILQDWLSALREEQQRGERVLERFELLCASNKVWDKLAHIELGYRPFFSTYYYLYNIIRTHSAMAGDWNIYSGGNNPVMNLSTNWKKICDFEFYWEFNYLEFCLKVRIDPDVTSRERLNTLRTELYPVLESIEVDGFRSQMRYGKWNSIYKWDFSNSIQTPDLIIQRVENDILSSYENLLTVAKNV